MYINSKKSSMLFSLLVTVLTAVPVSTTHGINPFHPNGLPVHQIFRFDIRLRAFTNSKGVQASKDSCDWLSSCDVGLVGFLDSQEPLSDWPGSANATSFTLISYQSNTNSFESNRTVSRSVCSQPHTQLANFRVEAFDKDFFSADDLIERFNCMIPYGQRDILKNETTAQWSSDVHCVGSLNTGVHLTFQYKAYGHQCGKCRKIFGEHHKGTYFVWSD